MIPEADDFRAESDALAALLVDADDKTLAIVTQFKGWTVEDVIAHLYMWNEAAAITLCSCEKFQTFLTFVMKRMGAGDDHRKLQRAWLDETQGGLKGRALFERWAGQYPALADQYAKADPALRVAWVGPDMSAQAKIIARQMETWAHGQEVFDALGARREEQDRIRNIVELGVRTYSFCFRNRGLEPPKPKPFLELTAPSGVLWTWNEASEVERITGSAVDFARVVTQTRNIADTDLCATGNNAAQWMEIAQCFAGPPEGPPAPGARFTAPSLS